MDMIDSFWDEYEKIAQAAYEPYLPDNKITPERFKRFLTNAAKGAVGAGLGYGVGGLIGRPLEKHLVEYGMRKGPAKVLRYALPTAAGLGAALSLAKTNMRNELFKRVRGGDTERHISTKQQFGELG